MILDDSTDAAVDDNNLSFFFINLGNFLRRLELGLLPGDFLEEDEDIMMMMIAIMTLLKLVCSFDCRHAGI